MEMKTSITKDFSKTTIVTAGKSNKPRHALAAFDESKAALPPPKIFV
jgi:hypothetical protein